MKIRKVALLSALGMALTSLTVYGVTEPSASAAPPADRIGKAVRELASPERLGEGFARFVSDGTLGVEARIGHAHMRPGAHRTYVTLEVTGSQATAVKRPPVHLAMVVDKSGSMEGDRIDNAIHAAQRVVDNLADGDTVAVIAFDTGTETVVSPTALTSATRDDVKRGIAGIQLGGDTCISCGVERAMDALRSARTDGALQRVLLLSDGAANNGIRDVAGFQRLARMCRTAGVAVSTIGLGVDYNERVLAALALESNGLHHFVEDALSLSPVLEAETRTAIHTIASATEAQIQLAGDARLVRVHGRAFRRDGERIVVPLGTFAPGEVKTVLLELDVSAEDAGARNVADVSLHYTDLVRDRPVTAHGVLATMVGERHDPLDPFVATRLERSVTSEALREANALAEIGDFARAQRKLEERLERLKDAAAANKDKADQRNDPRGASIDDDFEAQIQSTEQAANRFRGRPAPAKAKAAARASQVDAFNADL